MQTEPDPEELLPSALDGLEADRAASAAAATAFSPGDLLKDGQYRPFRKIGQGQSAHVWLARDMGEGQNRYVAIKVSLTWSTESQKHESSIMKMLRDNLISDHPGKEHVIELLDPNGDHSCIVSRPLGRSVGAALTESIWDVPAPYSFCRRISIQALQVLDYLHQKAIMHDTETDIEAKNTHRNKLNEPGEPNILDDNVDIASGGSNANVILVDLGASKSPKDTPGFRCAYPIPYWAPEVVLDIGGFISKADLWALGCVLWRIVNGNPLFAPEGWGSMDETNIEQIVIFVERLGPVPDSLRSAWIDSDRHLTPDGLLKNSFPEDERELPLAEDIREAKPERMGEDEATAFVEFLSLIFF